ncbi:MAG: hypothetical protein QME68_01820 [Elusimicrobiota bacterium]|nr:hypothetical protein [Elusimicrobiota bacterium]
MMKIVGRNFFAILLLPLCYGIGKSFIEVVIALNTQNNTYQLLYFITGFVFYITLQIFLFKPIKLYIFGHELTHAIAGIISGGRVKSFKVKKNTGSVGLTKVNLFVTLAPYFVPVYAIILILLYLLLYIFAKSFALNIYKYFLFLLGVSIAFHIALTQGQSDIKKYGVLYSLILVFISNCIILIAILSVFFQVSFLDFIVWCKIH